MRYRIIVPMLPLMALLGLMLLLMPGASGLSVRAQQGERCFPETNQCISGVIRDYWENNGGLAVFGYPTTPLHEATIEGSWTGPVQWFERDRLEDHGEMGVMAGRLGADILERRGDPWQEHPTVSGPPAGCRYFPETRHSLCPPFLTYWQIHGGLERFGYPITEPFNTAIGDWSGTVQYFERRRMEHHTENRGTRYEVLLGLLGNEVRSLMDAEPAQPAQPTSTPAASPTASPTSAPYPAPPTDTPTASPSAMLTMVPTTEPTAVPTTEPTAVPTTEPTATPTPLPPQTVLPTSTPVSYDPGVCLSTEEAELARLINEHRRAHGLPDAPLSRSLSYVAQMHVRDLEHHRPHHETAEDGQQCNMHSWSDNGDWTPVCYTPDHQHAAGMWDKPAELTDYPGKGYENSYGHSARATAEGAIAGWKNSSGHNAVIIEEGIWEGKNWQAMGVGIYGKYAVAWFGEEPDPEGTIPPCP